MIVYIKEDSQKKVYHFLKEKARLKPHVLLLLRDYISFTMFKEFLPILKEKFPTTKFDIRYLTDYPSEDSETLPKDQLIASDLRRKYNFALVLPDIWDVSQYNIRVMGIPGFQSESVRTEIDILRQYGYGTDYIFIFVPANANSKSCASLVEDIFQTKSLLCILAGDLVSCAETVNNTKLNPIIIFDQFLAASFSKNAVQVIDFGKE